MTSDPTRLLDDPSTSAALRADLGHAASASVQGLDVAAGIAGLRTAIATETGAVATATAGGSLLGKVLVAAVVVAAGGAAIWAGTADSTPVAKPEVGLAPALEMPAQPEPRMVPVPKQVGTVAPEVPPEPAEVVPVEVEKSEPPAPKRQGGRVASRRPGAAKTAVIPPDTEEVRREAQLVADARKALRRDPRRALSLLDEVATSFPRGMLREEREALSIMALVKLGKTAEAQRRSAVFLKKHGTGPYADAVRRAVD